MDLYYTKKIEKKDSNYVLTEIGVKILQDQIFYYKRILKNFFYSIKTNKKFALQEIRKEQQSLRSYLISNKPNKKLIFINI